MDFAFQSYIEGKFNYPTYGPIQHLSSEIDGGGVTRAKVRFKGDVEGILIRQIVMTYTADFAPLIFDVKNIAGNVYAKVNADGASNVFKTIDVWEVQSNGLDIFLDDTAGDMKEVMFVVTYQRIWDNKKRWVDINMKKENI